MYLNIHLITVHTGYIYNVIKYTFRSSDVKAIPSFSVLSTEEVLSYDYLIITDKNDEIKSFLKSIEKYIEGNIEDNVIKIKF